MGTAGILNSLAMIFIMIVPGFVLKKKKIINETQTKGISSLIVNVTWPCLVIDAMQLKFSKEILNDCIYTFFILIIIFVLAFIFSILVVKLCKLEKSKSGILAFMFIFGNTGFIGLPVINALYGKTAAFYASIIEMVNDILIFTVGIMLIQYSAGTKTKMDLKGLLSPGIFGVVVGFTLFMTNTQLPGFLGDTVQIIGSATTPLSMIVIGSQLAELKIKELISVEISMMTIFKLLVIPLLSILLIRIILGNSSLLSTVIILDFAMPVGACITIFSQQYDADVDFATKGVLVSTLFCLLTVPVFAIMLK